MDRITESISEREELIQQALRTGQTTPTRLEVLRRNLDMDVLEFVKFQELKTLAVASGTLSLEEGNTVYRLLGESYNTFNRQPLAVKVVLTKLFEELLRERLHGASGKKAALPRERGSGAFAKKALLPLEHSSKSESVRKSQVPEPVIYAISKWVESEAGYESRETVPVKDLWNYLKNEASGTLRSVLAAKKLHRLAWWDVERAIWFAVDESLNITDPAVWVSIVARLNLHPEDTVTLPLYGRRRKP